MNNLKLSCDEANHVCDRNQYREAKLWDKIKLSIHLIYCSACRKYTKNNVKLTKILNSSKIEVLDTSSKEKIRTAFEQELSKHQQN